MTLTVPPITVGRLLAERLAKAGVRHVFGFPGGGSNLDLIEELAAVGVSWVLAHTEGGAAFMACAAAEITGVPGVVVVGNGPGLTSVVNGVAHAHLDRVPLLVVSDRYTEGEAASTGHQVLDQRALLAPLVRFGATLDARHAARDIDAALAAATRAPAGPVHLDMPRDLVGTLTRDRGQAPPSAGAPASADGEIAAAAELLRRAERPVILVGLEANAVDVDSADLLSLARDSGAAVLTTYKAKGTLAEDDPRWAGVFASGVIEAPFLRRADAMLLVGLDPIELLAGPWPYATPSVAMTATDGGATYFGASQHVVSGIGAGVRALAAALRSVPGNPPGWPDEEISELRQRALGSLRLDQGAALPGWRVVETVAGMLPSDVTIAVDAGAHMFPATAFSRPKGPRRLLISNGLATMGFAVPSAVGAAVARPDDPVAVALTGDGGMAYHADELETANRLGVRVIVVVFNDSSLSLIRIKQEAKGHARRTLDFGLTRFDLSAEGLGAAGVRVETAEQLADALRDALSRDRSTVIDVRMTGAEYAETMRVVRGPALPGPAQQAEGPS